MASIVTQSDQNGPKWSKMGPMCPKWVQKGVPKRVPKGVKKKSKRGSQNGSPEVGTKKKSKNIFYLAPLQGVIQAPPPLKTRFCRGFGHPHHAIAEFRKKCGNPPEGWSSGGDFRIFFSKIGDNMVRGGETFLKNWSKRGVPLFWALFGNFGDFR